MGTAKLLELVDRLENDRLLPEENSDDSYESIRKALRKLEMLEQGARQIFLNSL